MNIKWLIGAISVGLFISCENVKEAQTVSNSYPSVFPDYTFTAIPYNIAPLNFEVKGAQEIRADFAGEGVNLLTVTGKHEIRNPEEKVEGNVRQTEGQRSGSHSVRMEFVFS